MYHNPVIDTLMARRSVRKFTPQKMGDETLETIVRAGQQAPFAGQLCSLIVTRRAHLPFHGAVMFTICVDLHRMELIMARRGWKTVSNNLSLLIFGIQDASLVAENMIIAAESLGLGSCLLGNTPYEAPKLRKYYKLPPRVFPLVQLVMGYPDETYPIRPRYPMEFNLFEERYPELTDEMVTEAMREMDEGYLNQDYYKKQKAMIRLEKGKKETFTYEDYSWTEHISRKWGQWMEDPEDILGPLRACGFPIRTEKED
jgi:FMN reductase (NADPH)